MVNAPSHHSLAGARPRATGLVASALLVMISVDYGVRTMKLPPAHLLPAITGTEAAFFEIELERESE